MMIMMEGKHYKIDAKNLAYHELIGLDVRVAESTSSERVGIKGKVVDETKNTLKLDTGKILPKTECVFEFDINEKILLDGKTIMKRPEDRVKEWRN